MSRSIVPVVFVAVVFVSVGVTTIAQSNETARTTAKSFLALLDSGDVRKAYRTELCDIWKNQATEEAWVGQMTPWMLQRQGPPKEREIIDEKAAQLLPGMPPGPVFAIRYKATYAAGSVYEDVVAHLPNGGPPCIAGFTIMPAPF
jgi:hypothetical protein